MKSTTGFCNRLRSKHKVFYSHDIELLTMEDIA